LRRVLLAGALLIGLGALTAAPGHASPQHQRGPIIVHPIVNTSFRPVFVPFRAAFFLPPIPPPVAFIPPPALLASPVGLPPAVALTTPSFAFPTGFPTASPVLPSNVSVSVSAPTPAAAPCTCPPPQ